MRKEELGNREQDVEPDVKIKNISESEAKKLDKKIQEKLGKGVTLEKICSDITIEQAKALAEIHEVDVDKNDTVQSIMEAVVEDYKE